MQLSLRSSLIGFGLSLSLTLIPYALVTQGMLGRTVLILCVVVAAVLQLVVQLQFFLHISLGPEERPRLQTLLFAVFMVFVVVAGSLWIMHDLNYFMMEPIMKQMPTGHGHHGH